MYGGRIGLGKSEGSASTGPVLDSRPSPSHPVRSRATIEAAVRKRSDGSRPFEDVWWVEEPLWKRTFASYSKIVKGPHSASATKVASSSASSVRLVFRAKL